MSLLKDFKQTFDRIASAIEQLKATIEKLSAGKAADAEKVRIAEAGRIAAEEKAESLSQELAIVSAKLVEALEKADTTEDELELAKEVADRNKANAELATQELGSLKAAYAEYKATAEAKDVEQESERNAVLESLQVVTSSLEALNGQIEQSGEGE